MRKESFEQIRVIDTETAETFEMKVNAAMQELADKTPRLHLIDGSTYRAIIRYTESVDIVETVKDEFHLEGNIYLCKHCPHMKDPHDRRIKRTTCKYSPSGVTHKDGEACELFYKQLKQGLIEPIDEYKR